MMVSVVLKAALLACVASLGTAEIFTSLAHLEAALYAEKDIAAIMKSFISKERERLDKLEIIATDYERHSAAALQNPPFYLANPVNAFLLIKRFTLDWDQDVGPILSNNTWNDFIQDVQYARQGLPKFEDLTGAVTALMRLQDTYHLDAFKFSDGLLGGAVSTPLSADDCFDLAKVSYSEADFYHAARWLEEALDLLGNDESRKERHVEMLSYLALTYYEQGYVKHALTLINELLTLDPGHTRAFNTKRYFEDMLVKQGEDVQLNDEGRCPAILRVVSEYRRSKEFQTYEALCRGERTRKIKDEHKLKCRYVHNNNPLLILSPVKEEEAHLDPWIVVYHDIISDSEISDIKFLATPKLKRAAILSPTNGQLKTATSRISKSAWLFDKDHPTIEKINRRIEAVTGLDMSTAEELQIANYGVGGHYEPHADYGGEKYTEAFVSSGTGNRIATYLVYMTDMEAGGATVFPYLGVKLFPRKGTAAFWYNLDKKGDGIYNTRHAACPVLVGVKWVASKWIHERGQEWRRPCSFSPEE